MSCTFDEAVNYVSRVLIEKIHSLKDLEILVDESMQQSVHKFITVPFFQHEKYIDDTIQILHKYNGSPQVDYMQVAASQVCMQGMISLRGHIQ